SNAPAASSRVSVAPVATLAMSALNSSVTLRPSMYARAALCRADLAPTGRSIPGRGDIEEVFQQHMAMLGRDAFGMKLHAVHGQTFVRQSHHQPVAGLRRHDQIARHAGALDHQRMIACR